MNHYFAGTIEENEEKRKAVDNIEEKRDETMITGTIVEDFQDTPMTENQSGSSSSPMAPRRRSTSQEEDKPRQKRKSQTNDIADEETKWKDIESGIIARTFKQASR